MPQRRGEDHLESAPQRQRWSWALWGLLCPAKDKPRGHSEQSMAGQQGNAFGASHCPTSSGLRLLPSTDGSCHLHGSGHLCFHRHHVEVHQVVEGQVKHILICTNREGTTLPSALARSTLQSKTDAPRCTEPPTLTQQHLPGCFCQAQDPTTKAKSSRRDRRSSRARTPQQCG